MESIAQEIHPSPTPESEALPEAIIEETPTLIPQNQAQTVAINGTIKRMSKPRSAYIIFMQMNKELAKSRSKGGKDFLTLISEMWKELEPVSKKHYQEISRMEKEKYQEYLKTLPEEETKYNKNRDLIFQETDVAETRNLRPKISNEQMRRILNPAYESKDLTPNLLKMLSKGAESFLRQNVQRSIRENKTRKLTERVLFDAIKRDFRLGFLKDVEGLFEDERLQDWNVRSKRKGNLKSVSKKNLKEKVDEGRQAKMGIERNEKGEVVESNENGDDLGNGGSVGESGSNGIERGFIKEEDQNFDEMIKSENKGFESLEYLKKQGIMAKNSKSNMNPASPLRVKTQNAKNNKSMFDFFAKK